MKMKIFSRLRFSSPLLSLALLSACGAERSHRDLQSSPPVEDIDFAIDEQLERSRSTSELGVQELRVTESLAYPDQPFVSPGETAACDFWSQLSFHPGDEAFQIVADLELVKGSTPLSYSGSGNFASPTSPEKDSIIGRHIPERLPHLLYFLSRENDEDRFVATLEKFHNPPTANQVREHVRQNGSFWEKKFLWTQSDQALLKSRNRKIIEGLENLMPGIHSGRPGSLSGKIAFETLEPFVNEFNFNRAHFSALSPLGKVVPLFRSNLWIERERELRQSLAILDRPNAENLSFKEKVCQFAIYHRVVAQLIRLKGVSQAPVLNSRGTLADLPLTDRDPKTGLPLQLPAQDIPGLFQEMNRLGEWIPVVVTSNWVSDQVAAMNDGEPVNIRIKDPLSLSEKLAALRYLVTLTAYRSNHLFDIFPLAPDSRPRILKKLQKMGIAMFGLALHTLKEREFPMGKGIDLEKARFQFVKEDSAENVAYLMHTVIEALESLARLRNDPHADDRELLTTSQMESFSGTPEKDGVVDSLEKLLMILVVEGKARMDEGRGSRDLKHALDRAVVRSRS